MASKLSKRKQLLIDQIYDQKQLVAGAFKVLSKAFVAWDKAMNDRIVAIEENKPGWDCGNTHQYQINGLRDEAEKFALKMGIPSYDFVVNKLADAEGKIMDEVEDGTII